MQSEMSEIAFGSLARAFHSAKDFMTSSSPGTKQEEMKPGIRTGAMGSELLSPLIHANAHVK